MPDARRSKRRGSRRGSLRPRRSRHRDPRDGGALGAGAFHALVESGSDGMILASDRAIILYANPAAARLLGHPPTELVGRLGFDMCRPEDVPLAQDAFARCLAQPDQVVPVRVAVMHADGGVRHLAVQLLNRIAHPGVAAVVVHFREAEDLDRREEGRDRDSEQRRLEAQLRQAQKMEAVGRMTAGIAHDFNNVLSVILGSAQLLADTLGPDAEEAEELATLRAAGERGAAMVRKLLGFSRQTDLHIEPTDLGLLVEGLSDMVRHLVPKRISIGATSAPGSLAAVDRSAVEQMVLNLVTNARDAMPRSGALHIDVRAVVFQEGEVRAEWMPPGAFVRLSVTDSGVGMDGATRARVFEPFFTTKPAGVGTGLGLPMVYGLAKQQRGFVEVRSAPGQGTTVSLYFPQAAAAAGS